MSNLANIVTVSVDPDVLDQIRPAMLANARNSVEEEGCYQFDVVVSDDDPTAFLFYEIYKDAEALASHRETPHFLAYWKILEELGDKVRRTAQLYHIVE